MTGMPREERGAAEGGEPEPPPPHAVWSVNGAWSGRFLVLVALLAAVSIGWVAFDTRSLTQTLGAAGSCAVASALASVLMIEGGGRLMVSAAERWVSVAERWRRYREEPARLRAEGRAEGRAETRVEVNAEWEAWLERRQAAEAAGEPFTEPNPADRGRNGDA